MNDCFISFVVVKMFIRVDLQNRFIPMWKSTHYINLNNVLQMEVKKTEVKIFTVTRPKYAANTIIFDTEASARNFAENCFDKMNYTHLTHQPSSIVKRIPSQMPDRDRMDQASPDLLAITAMEAYEEEKQLK